MKKILGIILAVCCLGSAFAVMPTANMSVATFDGDAGLKFEQKLDYLNDTNEFGFGNWANAKIKINLLNGGLESSKGKSIWGEISLKVDSADTGDKQNTDVGALSIGSSASVEYAKIHFLKGDVNVALNITAPEAKLGSSTVATAIPGATYSTSEITTAKKYGFGVEIRNYLADLDLIYNTNGVQKKENLKQSFVANSTLKGFINTNIYAGVAYMNKDLSYRLGADYNQAITDKLYVKPSVDFTYEDRAEVAASKLVAGTLIGWGNKDQDPGYSFDDTDDAKYNEGFSVAYESYLSKVDFDNGVYGNIVFALFQNSLVDGLSTAVKYDATIEGIAKGNLTLNAKYNKDFGVVGVTVEGKAAAAVNAFDKTELKYSVALWNNNVIANTDLCAKYVGETTVDGAKNTGAVEVYAKIHF